MKPCGLLSNVIISDNGPFDKTCAHLQSLKSEVLVSVILYLWAMRIMMFQLPAFDFTGNLNDTPIEPLSDPSNEP